MHTSFSSFVMGSIRGIWILGPEPSSTLLFSRQVQSGDASLRKNRYKCFIQGKRERGRENEKQ